MKDSDPKLLACRIRCPTPYVASAPVGRSEFVPRRAAWDGLWPVGGGRRMMLDTELFMLEVSKDVAQPGRSKGWARAGRATVHKASALELLAVRLGQYPAKLTWPKIRVPFEESSARSR